MAKYFFTNKAVEDLSKIYEELIDFCQLLSENPNIGKNYIEIDSEYFGFLANKHIIFYRILSQNEIEIERILGAEMDLKKRIKE
ncbi:MAG: type II toxin-antitoxin system RelE/ParE family toxin [Empedobacter falsenii]